MQFVNRSTRNVYTKFAGMLAPGAVTSGNGRESKILVQTLESIVNSVGSDIGIRLTQREAELIKKIIELDEAGCKFDPDSIPEDVRNDPVGARHAIEMSRRAQNRGINKMARSNAEAIARDIEINKEVVDEGPSEVKSMDSLRAIPSALGSGFDAIMRANSRIESGSAEEIGNILCPIGANSVAGGKGPSSDKPVDENAGAKPTAADKRSRLDGQAAEMAEALSPIGGVKASEEPKSKSETKDKPKTKAKSKTKAKKQG